MAPSNVFGESEIKFRKFEVLQVILPACPGFGLPTNAGFDMQPFHLVVGQTNRGFEAVGEASRVDSVDVVNQTLRGLLNAPINAHTPTNLWMRNSCQTGFFAGLVRRNPIYSWEADEGLSTFLMESLWLDSIGKASGVPAHVLLGGAVRRQIKVDYWAAQPEARELLQLVEKAMAHGCSGLKLKSNPKGNTVFAIAEIAKDLPSDFEFTVDAMFNWRSLHESRRIFSTLESLNFSFKIEDPFPFEAIDDWTTARRQYRQTLIWHTRGEDDLRVALREDLADGFNIACRSAHEAVRLAQVLAFHKKDCWFGSQLESGVFQQVRLHSASVAPTCVLPSDLQSQWVREHTLIDAPMVTRDGFVELSDAPGLGADLNTGALQRYVVNRWTIE